MPVAEPNGQVRSVGIIPNRSEAIAKLMKKLGPAEKLRVCYEAGPTGYVLYWQLTALGVRCEVVAPTLVPTKAGDRVKTDRRDAEKLARCYRSGDLTPVWVPNAAHEARYPAACTGRLADRCAVNQRAADCATWSSAPGSSNTCVAPGTISRRLTCASRRPYAS